MMEACFSLGMACIGTVPIMIAWWMDCRSIRKQSSVQRATPLRVDNPQNDFWPNPETPTVVVGRPCYRTKDD